LFLTLTGGGLGVAEALAALSFTDACLPEAPYRSARWNLMVRPFLGWAWRGSTGARGHLVAEEHQTHTHTCTHAHTQRGPRGWFKARNNACD
jgi:hypothetical protein